MSKNVVIELELPDDLANFQLPEGLNQRLQDLLDKRDRHGKLSSAEMKEAEGLVDIVDLLTLLKLKARRGASKGVSGS
jgi:hypothetical protein